MVARRRVKNAAIAVKMSRYKMIATATGEYPGKGESVSDAMRACLKHIDRRIHLAHFYTAILVRMNFKAVFGRVLFPTYVKKQYTSHLQPTVIPNERL